MGKLLPSKANALGFLAGLLVINIIGVIISTQFNLGHLLALGVEVSFTTRLSTTFFDLISMQPLFGVIFGLGFLIAMLVGQLITKWVTVLPDLVFTLAGFAAIAVTLMSLSAAFQITAIGAAREWDGFFSLATVGGLAGYAFSNVRTRIARG